jgi:hypothetical protein
MSYGAFGSTTNTFSDGAVGGSPVRKQDVLESVGNIMTFPFKDDLLDVTGNHTIDSGTPLLVDQDPASNPSDHYTYDNQNMLLARTTVSTAPRILASTQAHQIPLTEPVSFGFFLYMRSVGTTGQFMVSGPGGNESQYGLQRQSSAGWRFQGQGTTTMGDQRDITPPGRWLHVGFAVAGGDRSTGGNASSFYINGIEVWTGNVGNSKVVNTTDDFSFQSDSDGAQAAWSGFMCNCFLTDTIVDAATFKALSDESFGHASPFAPVV